MSPLPGLCADTLKSGNPGIGTIVVDGKWQFHTGDDVAWANPSDDDSVWEQLRSDDSWGAQTHPAYAGFAWYRKRLDVGGTYPPLSILIPPVEDAYELYWNGQKIGAYGTISSACPMVGQWT